MNIPEIDFEEILDDEETQAILESFYSNNKKPNPSQRKKIARKLGPLVKEEFIRDWFKCHRKGDKGANCHLFSPI